MKKVTSIIAIVLCAVIVSGLVSYDFVKNSNTVEKTYIAMGTVIKSDIRGKDAQVATAEIKELISGIENSYLSWRTENSDVWRINTDAGRSVSVSRETSQWISRCIDISVDCEGSFDITIGKISRLWNIGNGDEKVPARAEINSLLKTVGYKNVFVDDTTVRIGQGQAIDLGAVGKGIACDCIKDILDKYDIKSAVISVGGSILIYGDNATVGIVDPDNSSDYMATVEIDGQCVSTSGDYERYFEADGKKYHHIIDPESGYPSVSDLKSVTVICNSGLDSDALSTACFVMGYKKGLALLEKYDAQAVFIFDNNTVTVTEGLKNNFKLNSNKYMVE